MTPDRAIAYFEHGVKSGRTAQAYLISAEPLDQGVRLAERMLKLLYCRDGENCSGCPQCRHIMESTHPDVLRIEPQKKSRRISVEQVRDLSRFIARTSQEGGWKACAVVGADRLTDQASNAFLKTLEEPGGQTVFLLVTDSPQFIIPTVLSRCQHIALQSKGSALERGLKDELATALAARGGSGVAAAFGRATGIAAILDRKKKEIETEEMERMESEEAEKDDDILDSRVGARYRAVRTEILRFLMLWHRDILLLCRGIDGETASGAEYAEELRRAAANTDFRKALRNVRVIEEMHRQLERNLPEGTVLNHGFAALSR